MSQLQRTLLILPGGFGDGPAHRDRAVAAGLEVVGASSLKDDPEQSRYPAWAWLPHVAQPGFDAALAELIRARGVDQIHATHYVIWRHLRKVLADLAPGVELTLGRTNLDLENEYRRLGALVAAPIALPALARATGPSAELSAVEAAGFMRAALAIPGESYEAKLLALIEVAKRAPSGDIVEIGSLFGRTAAFLAMLSRRLDLGQVLCIDPWSVDESDQDADTLAEAAADYDWRFWRTIFEINVAPFAAGRLNYIQAESTQAAKTYGAEAIIASDAFGETRYEGRIGILHIDGNHEYGHVVADSEAWAPKVKSGGWIVFDDYEWDWGDGPKRVGDAYLAEHSDAVRTWFVAGGALFIQLN